MHHRVKLRGRNEPDRNRFDSLETGVLTLLPICILVKHGEDLSYLSAGRYARGHHGEKFIQFNRPIFILRIGILADPFQENEFRLSLNIIHEK